jgi:hypothetical protein
VNVRASGGHVETPGTYKTGAERFEGVMAQDVLEVMPDAVVVGPDGYYRVKYGQLGIRMTPA